MSSVRIECLCVKSGRCTPGPHVNMLHLLDQCECPGRLRKQGRKLADICTWTFHVGCACDRISPRPVPSALGVGSCTESDNRKEDKIAPIPTPSETRRSASEDRVEI